jgi:hypothetical protein
MTAVPGVYPIAFGSALFDYGVELKHFFLHV